MPRKKKEDVVVEDTNTSIESLDKIDEVKSNEFVETKNDSIKDTSLSPIKKDSEEKSENLLDDENQILTDSEEKKIIHNQKKSEKKRLKKFKRGKAREHIERVETNINEGLNEDQVNERYEKGYVNIKNNKTTKSIKKIIFTNVFTFFNILMIAIAAWLISVGAIKDLFFMVIVTLNVVIGIVQEIRAKITIDKLSILSSPTCKVLRSGTMQEIGVEDLVIDDIIIFESGKQISSDSIVVDGTIEVNEALLTGESDAIVKRPGDTLYSGSFVVSGNCKARVSAIGEDNYIDKLTKEAKRYNKPKSELLQSLNIIIRFMAVVIIPIGAILFCMQFEGLLGQLSLSEATRKTAGAMIGMIPSGLYLLTSIALAVGVMRLAQNNVLVQELYCIEMLARVDTLCLDKTGTITDGTMTVKNVIEYNGIPGLSVKNIVSAILNAQNADNMTNKALEEKFGRAKRIKHLNLIPFSSSRKFSAVTFDKVGTFVMGAPEFVLTTNYKLVSSDVTSGAKLGYRVLVIAHTNDPIIDGKVKHETLEPVALIYIEDTIRPDAIETIKYFKDSGVDVKVISGDNPLTVSRISMRAGISNAQEYVSLDGMTDLEVVRAATKYTVFGRVSPAQKKLIVTTLKEAGKTVAMTGDGVNDILALKEADCSISVASGSEAARNVSHLVLLDNNFGSMPKVVSEGRRVINNVAKVSKLFLTKTIFSLLLAIYAINSGGNYPISTNQLIMIDFFCIGLPSFFLVLEPNNSKSSGGFLLNIIKGALPGAITILINAMIVLNISTALDLSKSDTSTLIVIIATFTCLIVLYQTCKPWKLYKKFMYAFLFIACVFITLLLPRFLDFTPLTDIGVYYDKDLEVVSVDSTPSIEVSKDNYLVIDEMYTTYVYSAGTASGKYTLNLTNEDGNLAVNGTITDTKINVVSSKALTLSNGEYVLSTSPKLALGGVDTNSKYTEDIDVQVSYDGYVFVNGVGTGVNILPTVTISQNNKYIINGTVTEIESKFNEVREIHIQDYKIYVNDEYIGENVAPVNLSIDNENEVFVQPSVTELNYNEVEFDKLGVASNMKYTYNGDIIFTTLDDGTTEDYKYTVSVDVSEAGHWVIAGKYTDYKASGNLEGRVISHNDNNQLIINGTVTDYVVTPTTTYGGEVSTMPLSAILLMVALCALTTPIMSLIRAIVPWIKELVDTIKKVVGRL